MNINRNNYEEYFLLYADNELSGQEKNIVEAFVKQHADLKEEFLLIRQSVIKPDSGVKLENKNFLFKETDKFINKYNYLEIFVLYNDDELSQSEKQETEAFLLQNPSLRSEFELLQKTKFQPDINIVFPGKKILFKKEQDEKIIPLKWWKLAAAAVLFGSGIFIGVELLQKDNKNVPVAVKNTTPKKLNKINLIIPDIKRAETVIADTARIDKESTTNTDTPQQMVLEKGKKETPYIKKAAENE